MGGFETMATRGGLRVASLLGQGMKDIRFYSSAYKAKEMTKENRRYHWIEPEAERLIARAYARHRTLVERDVAMPNGWKSFPPSISLKDLESEAIAKEYHYEPRTLGDRIAK